MDMWWRKISLWGVQEDFRVEVVIDLCLEGWVSRLDWETEEQNNILGGGNGIHKGLEAGKCGSGCCPVIRSLGGLCGVRVMGWGTPSLDFLSLRSPSVFKD